MANSSLSTNGNLTSRQYQARNWNLANHASTYIASFNSSLDSSISWGLNRSMSTQNSFSFSTPSSSRSPSRSIDITSSSLIPTKPRSARFFFRLSNVITPLYLSTSSPYPLLSSFMNPSAPSFSTINGKKSSKMSGSRSPWPREDDIVIKCWVKKIWRWELECGLGEEIELFICKKGKCCNWGLSWDRKLPSELWRKEARGKHPFCVGLTWPFSYFNY